ncbi:hypothetical protein [Marinigracilibium pacificum]|uniref:Uncharacterized protein n=1 Tax=Marinigracilibium pacificum TaxID=2729599 RepID=A0A848J8R4_9BACT|nr:hypothetical protein [Marinigracilibium pacificum]NMM50769.1 hypothetical protein [Marinigracilibium pacificum]
MKKLTSFIILFLTLSLGFSQNRKNWTELDYLNADEFRFQTENDITGKFFVTVSDNFNYYTNPIIIKDLRNKEIVKIEFSETGIDIVFEGIKYQGNDTSNPLKPWLLMLNPDFFRLVFECVDITANHYVVKLNENEVGYIATDNPDFKRVTIEDFIKHWTELGFDFDRSTNPLRTEPNEGGQIILNSLNEKYKIWTGGILELRSDWLKIRTINDEVGWIKWRDGQKVLIKMYYAC